MIAEAIPHGLIVAWVAAVGAVLGSFLNVVIARLPAGESLVRPRSRCPRCQAPIAWYDNVPVISWLILRARCRRCRVHISVRYPIVEMIGTGAALLALARHGLSGAAAAELIFVDTLVALAFIDIDSWLLPHALTRPLIAYGLAMSLLGVSPAPVRSALYGAGVGFGAFLAVAYLGEKVFHKEALGGGDVWLLAGLGAWLGLPALLPVVLLASVEGSVVGLALLALGRGEPGPAPGAEAAAEGAAGEAAWTPPRHAVPFGPFLVAGALEWMYLGEYLVRLVPSLGLFLP